MSELITSMKEAQNSIKLGKVDPYVAIIGPHKVDADFSKLEKYGVSAMMFCAGSLYDSSHNKKKVYKNSYLDDQVKRCMAADMPFALYADVRAKNEIEADAECRVLYYIIAEHSPKLGLWLRMQTGSKIAATNDKILNVYYKYIVKWGLKDRCGIYIEKSKINTFSWGSFQDKFYLLAIDHMSSFKSVENKLLTPEMFEMPN